MSQVPGFGHVTFYRHPTLFHYFRWSLSSLATFLNFYYFLHIFFRFLRTVTLNYGKDDRHQRWPTTQGFLPQLYEFHFTTPGKNIVENCRCSVPNFINDYFNSIVPTVGPYSLVPDPQNFWNFQKLWVVCHPWVAPSFVILHLKYAGTVLCQHSSNPPFMHTSSCQQSSNLQNSFLRRFTSFDPIVLIVVYHVVK